MSKYIAHSLFLGALILNIITCLVVWHYARSSSATLMPVHFSVVSGVDEVGSPTTLYQLPLFALAVWFLDLLLVWFLGGLGAYIKLLSASAALLVAVVIFVSALLLSFQGA